MTATFRTLERTDLNHVPERHAGVRHYFGEVSVAAERVANRSPEAFFVECGPPFEELCHRAPEDFQEGMEDVIPGCPRQPGGPDYASPENDDDDEEEDEDEEGLP
jgi:hypothetical protein